MHAFNRASQLLGHVLESQSLPVRACRRLSGGITSIIYSQSLPIRACRRLSGGIIGIVLGNRHVVGFFDPEGRHSISRSYFQSMTNSDEYECLTDPVDLVACEKYVDWALFGFEFKAGLSVVAGTVVGYRGSNAQEVIDMLYEARSNPPPLYKS